MMAVYFFTNTGWTFGEWEPAVDGSDVDVSMNASDGRQVHFQVKAPDRPGNVVGGMIQGGEEDAWVMKAIDKASKQLAKAGPHARIIVVSAARRTPLAAHSGPPNMHLFGSTTRYGMDVKLLRTPGGKFFVPSWNHISAVVALDYVRPADECQYFCTVLKNLMAEIPVPNSWSPRALLLQMEGMRFRWTPRAPSRGHGVPDGTELIEEPLW